MCERVLLWLLTRQKAVGDVGLLRHSLHALELPQIRDQFSANVGGLASSFSTVHAPAIRLPSCHSSFGLVPRLGAGAFQPRVGPRRTFVTEFSSI